MTIKEKRDTLSAVARKIEKCRACKINKIGKAVPGEGNANAKIVFLGEAPGKTEAEYGRPFIGRAGAVLRNFIQNAGLNEQDVFITSAVKYLPQHKTPTEAEVAHGSIHLSQQLKIIQPVVVVLMGRVAALAVLKKNIAVAKEHGTILKQPGVTYLITYHPAAVLYNPNTKSDLRKDFAMLKKLIE